VISAKKFVKHSNVITNMTMISKIDGSIYLSNSSINGIWSPIMMYGMIYYVCRMYEISTRTTTLKAFHNA
jgi:hypothetical protein